MLKEVIRTFSWWWFIIVYLHHWAVKVCTLIGQKVVI